jgi:AcrR family transcriptional regulator
MGQEQPNFSPTEANQLATRSADTKQALIDAARKLFVENGYFQTGTEEIVRAAGVTRGALYHHFSDKKALFLAVFEAIEDELIGSSAQVTTKTDSFTRLQKAMLGFLDASLTPEVQRVLLIDGPAVLGWQEWRALEAKYGLGIIQELLNDAIEEGVIPPQPVSALAHILLAAVDEAALYIANSSEPIAARDLSATAIQAVMAGLTGKSPE